MAALLSIGSITFANAAGVKVLAARMLQTALKEIAPQFERATGNKLAFVWGIDSEIAKKVMNGVGKQRFYLANGAITMTSESSF